MTINLPSQQDLIAPDRNLLLIDDDPVIRRSIRRLLVKHFRLVLEAADRLSALQAINGLGETDIILSDLHLSAGNHGEGFQIAEVTREMRKERGLTFILCSSESTEGGLIQIGNQLSAGIIDAFIPKPYDIEDLRITIQEALRNTQNRQ